MNKEILESIVKDLRAGKAPVLSVDDFPNFSAEANEGKDFVSPLALERIASSLSEADIPTFERAIQAIDEADLAWLGFKIVIDPVAAVENSDNEVTKKYGDQGSADGEPLVFFCNDAKELVASREFSPRDFFQMKDVTRGPSMHNDQFLGLTWTSIALFDPVRVWILGASDAASEVASLAEHVGFEIKVVDYDKAYLNENRFPGAERILLSGFDELNTLQADQGDYVCVLTRGHMFDPEGCLWALRNKVHYVGMMGCAGKNDRVYELCHNEGMSDAEWNSIKRPIGLKFGAKTPAELAISIVAELVDVRYKQRYSEEAQMRHESSLGRVSQKA